MKYLPDDYFAPEKPPQSNASKTYAFIFRFFMLIGIIGVGYWFYENKDQILANIRNNSENYDMIFADLTHSVDPEDIKEVDVEQPVTNASFSAPLDNLDATN